MKKYITLVGKDYWKTLNSIWAVVKEDRFLPDELFLISEKENLRRAKILKKDIDSVLSNYGLDTDIDISLIDDGDEIDVGTEIQNLIKDGDEVALDITGGRKYLVAGSLVNPYVDRFDHVFYLYVNGLEDHSRPYPTIPAHEVKIKDFIDLQDGVDV